MISMERSMGATSEEDERALLNLLTAADRANTALLRSKNHVVADLQAQIATLNVQVSALNAAVVAGRSEAAKLFEQLESCRRDLAKTEFNLQAANDRVTALLGSFSWRVTAPVRRATSILRVLTSR
jgi:chromosome segregation ATPase